MVIRIFFYLLEKWTWICRIFFKTTKNVDCSRVINIHGFILWAIINFHGLNCVIWVPAWDIDRVNVEETSSRRDNQRAFYSCLVHFKRKARKSKWNIIKFGSTWNGIGWIGRTLLRSMMIVNFRAFLKIQKQRGVLSEQKIRTTRGKQVCHKKWMENNKIAEENICAKIPLKGSRKVKEIVNPRSLSMWLAVPKSARNRVSKWIAQEQDKNIFKISKTIESYSHCEQETPLWSVQSDPSRCAKSAERSRVTRRAWSRWRSRSLSPRRKSAGNDGVPVP